MRYAFPLTVLFVSACSTQPAPGEGGSAEGSYSAAFVNAFAGGLQIVISQALDEPGPGACASQALARRFMEQEGVRIRLLAVDGAGILSLSDDFFAEVAAPREGVLDARDEFVAAAVLPGVVEELHPELASVGMVELDEPPDYDTGRVVGRYELEILGHEVRGSFDTAFCQQDALVDAAAIAEQLDSYCGITPDAPYAPGASKETRMRDLRRGIRAMGLKEAESACIRNEVSFFCMDGFPPRWVNLGLEYDCLLAKIDSCLGQAPATPLSLCHD